MAGSGFRPLTKWGTFLSEPLGIVASVRRYRTD